MSYILDALRRAETERERDRHLVPGVHAAQPPLPQADGAAWAGQVAGAGRAGRSRGLLWSALALALAAAAAFGVWRWGGFASSTGRSPGPGPAATSATPTGNAPGGAGGVVRGPATAAVPPGMVAQIDGPPVPARAAAEANARALEAAALPAANAEKPLTAPGLRGGREAARDAPRAPPRDAPQETPRDAPRDTPRAAPSAAPLEAGKDASRSEPGADAAPEMAVRPGTKPAVPPAPPPAAANLPAPVVPLNALAPELRSQIPPMVVGGAIYSDRPANRFVLINGQVVREGESPATGVLLERIGPKSAVMRWREMRFEMPLQ
jgi:general secretion pathway protein B